jgi:GH15 family glucan-1,4-alpha-glucosidase
MPPIAGPLDVRSLRLVAGELTSALVDGDGSIVWWCGPRPDGSPVLWRLLGPEGGVARWCDRLDAVADDDQDTADACMGTWITVAGGRFLVTDWVLDGALVRTLEAQERPVTAVGEVVLEPFERLPDGDPAVAVSVTGADRTKEEGPVVRVEVDLEPGRPRHLVIAAGPTGRYDLDDALADRRRRWDAVGRRVRLPRDHPQRAMDALRVLSACTYALTGAVIASPTTSVPEAPGGERQWDYRFSWLRDATIAASVASQLGQPRAADRYLDFVCRRTRLRDGATDPIVTVTGDELPPERELHHELWSGAAPVRVGNGASDQEQVDALGFFGEALWTHLLSGGRVSGQQRRILEHLADRLVPALEPSSGIWELRDEYDLVSAEIGRWLLLDRALRLRRVHRPWRRSPAAWTAACADASRRVLAAIDAHRFVPLTFDGPWADEPDATGLLAVVVGLLRPGDPRAHALVDATIESLGDGPFLRRYRTTVVDGFHGEEGAFVPASWWAVSALAVLGRIEEAEERADAMCEALPLLIPEEWDTAAGESRGNLPLVWSHMEAARALSLLHAARIQRRTGRPGLALWRAWRFTVVRLLPN